MKGRSSEHEDPTHSYRRDEIWSSRTVHLFLILILSLGVCVLRCQQLMDLVSADFSQHRRVVPPRSFEVKVGTDLQRRAVLISSYLRGNISGVVIRQGYCYINQAYLSVSLRMNQI